MHTTEQPSNKLLNQLSQQDSEELRKHLEPVELKFRQVLCAARGKIVDAYFPVSGCVSALNIMTDGNAIEVATIGNEGIVGVGAVFGADESANQLLVQIPGHGLRIPIEKLKAEARTNVALLGLLTRFNNAYFAMVSQSVACNGLHNVTQRCCRWLLITHDRLYSDEIPLTNEFLSIMLGVRRPTVTETLQLLQQQGLIDCGRGKITVVDRAGLEAACCECYQVVKNEQVRLFG